MRYALWPEAVPPHEEEVDRFLRGEAKEPEAVVVADFEGVIKGFAEFSIRSHAEGCVSNRVGYVEGWYVEPDARRRGVGRALIVAGEEWARQRGCVELASDCLIDNDISAAAHKTLGFEEVERIRCFRKSLRR
jgi:aminoglycoside 6'-N-acetyltransferase I